MRRLTSRCCGPEIAVLVQDWVEQLPITAERTAVEHFFGWATGLASHQVLGIGIGALLYASLFLLEGVGLWRRKTWAEWLTVVATSLPIPLEVYEVVRHLSPLRVLALFGNVVVVWLLVSHLRRLAKKRSSSPITTGIVSTSQAAARTPRHFVGSSSFRRLGFNRPGSSASRSQVRTARRRIATSARWT